MTQKNVRDLSEEELAKYDAEMEAHSAKLLRVPDPPAPDGNNHWPASPHGEFGSHTQAKGDSLTLGEVRELLSPKEE